MIGNILLGCIAFAVVMAMLAVWFPDLFTGETVHKLLFSSGVILVGAFVAGLVMWVAGSG